VKTSCVVEPLEGEMPQSKGTPRSCWAFRDAFTEAVDNTGQSICVRAGASLVRACDVIKHKDEFALRYATGEPDAKKRADATRKAYDRAIEKLSPEYATWVNGGTESIWKPDRQTL
jgi:hypothetical protein